MLTLSLRAQYEQTLRAYPQEAKVGTGVENIKDEQKGYK